MATPERRELSLEAWRPSLAPPPSRRRESAAAARDRLTGGGGRGGGRDVAWTSLPLRGAHPAPYDLHASSWDLGAVLQRVSAAPVPLRTLLSERTQVQGLTVLRTLRCVCAGEAPVPPPPAADLQRHLAEGRKHKDWHCPASEQPGVSALIGWWE